MKDINLVHSRCSVKLDLRSLHLDQEEVLEFKFKACLYLTLLTLDQ